MVGLTILAQGLFFVGLPVAARAASTPLISAVQITGGVGFTNNDFIELYNPTNQPFNLNGFRLVKRSATGITDSSIKSWTEDTFIPAYSFYLWANNTYTGITPAPDLVSSSTLANDNGVALRQGAADTGILVDSVSWGTTSNTFANAGPNPEAGQSVALKDPLVPASGYEIRTSLPRNSTVKLEPQNPPDPPVLIDNAACETSPQTLTVNPSATTEINIKFTNTGTTGWDPESYKVREVVNGLDLALGGSVAPAGSLESIISLISPSSVGSYSYSWQMRHTTENFGTACTLSLTVAQSEPPVVTPQIRINEFLPNPTGEDSGLEKIELYNYGSSAADLSGWILDDVAAADPLSTNALTLDATTLPAGAYLAITIPAGKFSLNNTVGEIVSLFNKDKQHIDTASFTGTAAENKSYSYFSSGWQWTAPTFGAVNVAPITDPDDEEGDDEEEPLGPAQISINEIYPFPHAREQEFIELFNDGDEYLQLSHIVIWVGDKSKALPDVILPPDEYYIVEGKALPAQLRNTGQIISLFSAGEQTDIVEYPKAFKGRSYSKFEDSFLWTLQATPGKPNQLVGPQTQEAAVAGSVTKQDPPASQSAMKSSVIKPKIAGATTVQNIPEPESAATSTEPVASPTQKKKLPVPALIAVGACTLAGGMWVSYRYAFREQPDFV